MNRAAPRILAVAGNTRSGSYNKKLARAAARGAEAAGAEVVVADLRDFGLPLFDEDLERVEGPPEGAVRLKQWMRGQDGLLIASPGYYSSVTAVLKNAIDWASRPAPGEPPLSAFRGKVAGLLIASPGALGGLRGLVLLRSVLGNIGVLVLPDQIAVVRAHEAFADDGSLKDPALRATVERLGRQVAEVAAKLRG